MSSILYILLAVAILLLMITIHELGHYSAGKILGFKIKEFAIGMGKKIYSKTNPKTGEVFSLRIFPLGGFCMFEGGEEDYKNDSDPRSFNRMKPWKRIIVLFSGVLFNFLSAILFSVILLMSFGYTHFIKVEKLSNGYVGPLNEGYIIQKVDGKEFTILNSISSYVKGLNPGDKVMITFVDNNGVTRTEEQEILLLTNEETGKKYSGIGLNKGETQRNKLGFIDAIGQGFMFTIELVVLMFNILGDLFSGAIPLSGIGGPFATISLMAGSFGMASSISQIMYMILFLLPMISINLAIFNLLPIPALDGARIVFIFIEWIRGKPINQDLENKIHFWGFMALIGMVVFFELNFFFFSKFLLFGSFLL